MPMVWMPNSSSIVPPTITRADVGHAKRVEVVAAVQQANAEVAVAAHRTNVLDEAALGTLEDSVDHVIFVGCRQAQLDRNATTVTGWQ